MRTLFTLLTAILAVFPMDANDKNIRVTARVNTPVISVRGGTIYVQVTISTPRIHIPKRSPMNLTVVLDRSGSMGEERKMEYARVALHKLIDQLQRDDMFSLVIYDDAIDVVQRPTRATDKRRLHSLVDEIHPRGATNLGGGLEEGLRLAAHSMRRELTNRVIILSDGLANRGTTDPRQLNQIVRRYRRESVSVTSMGVGLDYNENLMVGLAESGGGNYYFIESPSTLASIMHQELDAASSIACRNAVLEFQIGKGVEIKDIIGYEWTKTGHGGTISLGDLYQEEEREITLELVAPSGQDDIRVFGGNVSFEGTEVQRQDAEAFAMVSYTNDEAAIERRRDLKVQSKTDVAVSTRSVEQALEALDDGNEAEAAVKLEEAKAFLSASPAATAGAGAADVQQQIGRLDAFKDSVLTSDARRAKKAIQYENYLKQKSKKQ